MTVQKEVALRDFEWWCGATQNAELLTGEELDRLEDALSEEAENCERVFTEDDINDIMWFEFEDYVLPTLGLKPTEVEQRRKKEE